jgi:hypothetical protein
MVRFDGRISVEPRGYKSVKQRGRKDESKSRQVQAIERIGDNEQSKDGSVACPQCGGEKEVGDTGGQFLGRQRSPCLVSFLVLSSLLVLGSTRCYYSTFGYTHIDNIVLRNTEYLQSNYH